VQLRTEHGSSVIRLFHPGGGSSSYALSYQLQKIVESLTGGDKPAMLLCGHFHKSNYFMVRNVHCISAGCIMDQSAFMRKKHIEAHVAFWIVWVQQDASGAIRRVRLEETNYFDRGYHVKMVKDTR